MERHVMGRDDKIISFDSGRRSGAQGAARKPAGDMGQGSREYSFRGMHDPDGATIVLERVARAKTDNRPG
jgi:hypothetical protein